MVDFIAKRIHHRISYAWKCYYNAHLSKTLSFLFPFLSFSPFFLNNAKKMGRSDDAKQRNKRWMPF